MEVTSHRTIRTTVTLSIVTYQLSLSGRKKTLQQRRRCSKTETYDQHW